MARDLFTGTAEYYAKYRPSYPLAFFDFLIKEFSLDGLGRLLDLGCGTGQIAIPLASYFERVVGLDPEEDMLQIAEKEATKAGVNNAAWLLKRAEDIGFTIGRFRLATMGSSFHWMEQRLVLTALFDLIVDGGGVVVVTDIYPIWEGARYEWKNVRARVVKKYLGERRRAGSGFFAETDDDFEDILDESLFGGHKEWRYEYERTWTLEQVIGFLYSTSFAQKSFFGARLEEFEKEITHDLLVCSPDGVFEEKVCLQVLVARK